MRPSGVRASVLRAAWSHRWRSVATWELAATAGAGLLGVAYLVLALPLDAGRPERPGSGFFPLVVTGILIVSSTLALAQHLRHRPRERPKEQADGTRFSTARVISILGAVACYAILGDLLGHILTTFLVSVLLLRSLSRRSLLRVVLLSALISIGTQLFFTELLDLPLPTGPLQ